MASRANSRKVLVLTPADSRLIEQFVHACEGLSPEKAAESLVGVSSATVRRYMEGQMPTRMTTEVRQALREFLNSRATEAGGEGGIAGGDDEWTRFSLETVRYAGGGQQWSEEQRRLIKLDVLEGLIRLGVAEGRDVRGLQEKQRSLRGEGGEGAQPAGSLVPASGEHPLFQLLRIDAIAADKRADAAKDLAAAARIEAEEMQARRLALSESEILADEAQVWAAVDELDGPAAGVTHPTAEPASPRAPSRPQARRETR